MLNKVKLALRISNNGYDEEIQDLINSAKADLKLSGVSEIKVNNDTDSLLIRAVITYCKANFGWNNPDAEKLKESYEALKIHLSLSAEYNGGDTVVI